MEICSLLVYTILDLSERLETHVPRVREYNEPDHGGHQEVVHQDKDHDAG